VLEGFGSAVEAKPKFRYNQVYAELEEEILPGVPYQSESLALEKLNVIFLWKQI
jgi:hypothetical protein